MTETLSDRVTRLEREQATYQEMLQQSAQLTESLDLLILTAGTLSESLQQVERQQAAILDLQQEVASVKKDYSSKADVVAAKDEVRKDVEFAKDEVRRDAREDARAAALSRLRLIGIGVAFVMFITLGALYLQQNSADSRCMARNRQTDVLVKVLQDFGRTGTMPEPTATALNRGIQQLQQSEIDCTSGFHLPTFG